MLLTEPPLNRRRHMVVADALEHFAQDDIGEAQTLAVEFCVQPVSRFRDDGTFKLKDTTGVDAPKSRSWKSGFLKKRAASIEVVDAGNRLN